MNCGDHVMKQSQTITFLKSFGKSGVIVELNDYHQYDVKIDRSGRLTVQNRKFLRKLNAPGCISRSSYSYLGKANITLQKFVSSGKGEKNSKKNFDVVHSQKGICCKAGDNFKKFCKAKPATFLSHEDSNCMDESQSSTKQRNGVLSRLDPINKYRLSEKDFVNDGVSPENELHRSGRVKTLNFWVYRSIMSGREKKQSLNSSQRVIHHALNFSFQSVVFTVCRETVTTACWCRSTSLLCCSFGILE